MNNIREIQTINEAELKLGIHGGTEGSWHNRYKESAWVYVGGLSFELSEGDIICFMSQWGEIDDINLVRDGTTNKSLGYCFIKYENQKSTILAVDNFNGMKLLGRSIRCDHVDRYKLPKNIREKEEALLAMDPSADIRLGPGHVYKDKDLANEFSITDGFNVWDASSSQNKRKKTKVINGYALIDEDYNEVKEHKKHKKEKVEKDKKDRKEKKKHKDKDKKEDK